MQAAAQELEVVMIKRKRSSSKRPRLALTMATTDLSTTSDIFADRLTSSSSSSGDRPVHEEEEEDMANCLILLARGSSSSSPTYNCKTCNRSFPSFQALGGHRASHGKPNHKPMISPTVTYNKRPMIREKKFEEDNYQPNSSGGGGGGDNSLQVPKKSRVHECSICRAEFGSGQALGGHMRRHRPISGTRNIILSLDLNLPAAPEDIDPTLETNKFPFSPKKQVTIFSASPLVDCHY